MTDRIITFSRQFGSGGGEIAKELAALLGVPYVDKAIIAEAASASGIAKEYFEKADERRTNSFLFSLVAASYGGSVAPLQPGDIITDDKLFIHAADAVKKLAATPCVIVGRCADDILADRKPARIFISADFPDRVARIARLRSLDEKAAAALIRKTDKKRASYYNFYTSKTWGAAENYDLCLNLSSLPNSSALDLLQSFATNFIPRD
ncbi:MAG: cytidylate kinase-like family protein [Clostridiales bacterium]|jgi:cytidylate kinase|nr:cytidylate kinase-like family protein [Clostridiales bacterium]